MSRRDDYGWSLIDAIASFYEEMFAFAVFSIFGSQPKRRDKTSRTSMPERAAATDVAFVPDPSRSAEDPLEVPAFMRHLGQHNGEGSEHGREEDVSDEFLSQLEQRTQQVKITLANLEAEKIRIEGLIAQLQPIVPHYDALVAAERQLSQAEVKLDTAEAAPSRAEDGETASAGEHGGESPSAGWSGSWNS